MFESFSFGLGPADARLGQQQSDGGHLTVTSLWRRALNKDLGFARIR